MVNTQKRVRRHVLQLSIAAFGLTAFGAVVAAAPFALGLKPSVVEIVSANPIHLTPLASGPAIQLARADGGAVEDCVKVTRITGPDGKVYPTFGMVCSSGKE